MTIKIIPTQGQDIEMLKNIGIQSYKEHFSAIWTSEGIDKYLEEQFNTQKLYDELMGSSTVYFIAFFEEKPIGFIKLNFNQFIPKQNEETGLELQKIYFLNNFAGKGLGKTMFNFIKDYALEKREKSIWLDVLKTNTKAKKFYERQGFQVVDELDFETDKTKPDMWVMKLSL
jgi:diamine N-acetyltransferase